MSIDWTKVRHFKAADFIHPELLRPSMIYLLDEVRDRCGFAISISSSFRSPEHNAATPGAAADSSHVPASQDNLYSGLDIYTHSGKPITPRELFLIVKHSLDVGYTRIGLYKDMLHVHLDNSPYHDPEVIWIK
jgi:hypothetical protein